MTRKPSPDKYLSGLLNGTKDGLPAGITIEYKNAQNKPVITFFDSDQACDIFPRSIKFKWYKIDFGNGYVAIHTDESPRTITIPDHYDDLELICRDELTRKIVKTK